MRAVTTATAAAVLQFERKAFENFLLRIGSEAIPAGRQGVERRIAFTLLEELFVAKELNATLGVPARDAFLLARQLLGRTRVSPEARSARDLPGQDLPGQDVPGHLRIGDFLQVRTDLSAIRTELQHRYEAAVETMVRPQRGRPPRRPTPSQARSET